jgi:hypothetical protein
MHEDWSEMQKDMMRKFNPGLGSEEKKEKLIEEAPKSKNLKPFNDLELKVTLNGCDMKELKLNLKEHIENLYMAGCISEETIDKTQRSFKIFKQRPLGELSHLAMVPQGIHPKIEEGAQLFGSAACGQAERSTELAPPSQADLLGDDLSESSESSSGGSHDDYLDVKHLIKRTGSTFTFEKTYLNHTEVKLIRRLFKYSGFPMQTTQSNRTLGYFKNVCRFCPAQFVVKKNRLTSGKTMKHTH